MSVFDARLSLFGNAHSVPLQQICRVGTGAACACAHGRVIGEKNLSPLRLSDWVLDHNFSTN
jgi:hypothetical protein